ncbi:glucosamine-6-phosphate deaminase [Peribacillus kribbensis]|uniref:glucosamine-6-phosphate deaminase n=1 Tax=Peribacillus kribbensis TaxID=356658 RepID=UPI0004093CBE|nr:glucosamine-6-phosphate deaminase [Peribacillus kribbensis]
MKLEIKIIQADHYEEMSRLAAAQVIQLVKAKPDAVLGLATGGTPIGLYRELIEDFRANGTSYEGIHTINLDEYVGMTAENSNSYASFMKENLFSHINIKPENTNIPNGSAENLEDECKRYDALIESFNGADLQVLGIGRNGHIGFNEPGTSFSSHVHIVELSQNTREANARYFPSMDEVPEKALTMGIASILKSREILLLASGHTKAQAIKELLEGSVSEDFPASALKNHQKVTLIADQDALQLVRL